MVLVSALTLERSDAPALMNYINLLQENSNLINKEAHWNGFNVQSYAFDTTFANSCAAQ